MGITVMQGKPVLRVHVTGIFKELRENRHKRGEINLLYFFRNSFLGD